MKPKYMHFAGVDVSKSKIDVCFIVNEDKPVITHQVFDQSKKGFSALKKWLEQLLSERTHLVNALKMLKQAHKEQTSFK